MPYSIDNPPEQIAALPKPAQEIWIAAFNSALEQYEDDEARASATAWAAVEKAGYAKDAEGKWAKRSVLEKVIEAMRALLEPLFSGVARDAERAVETLPTQTRSLTITRTADGKARWFMIAASAAVNRVGAIDSTVLFDNFIKRAKASGQYPRLDFLHEEDRISFGQADWLFRDDKLYLASGTFDDTPLARAVADGLEKEPDYWGASIAYKPTTEPMHIVSEGDIPVYTDGVNTFISIVPKRLAANMFTATGVAREVKRMDAQGFDELKKLVGDEVAAPFAALVDDANRTIAETGMVTRTDAPAPVPTTPEPQRSAEPPAPVVVPVVVPAPAAPEAPAPEQREERQDITLLADRLAELEERLAKLEQQASAEVEESKRAMTAQAAGLETRLVAVEKNSQAWAEWLAGLPEGQSRTDATYRPRANATSATLSAADVADQTLANMKRGRK